MEMFSTITSPVFSELVIVLEGNPILYLPEELELVKTLRKMNEVKPFKLVFSLEVPRLSKWQIVAVLDLVAVDGLFNFLDSPPTVRCAPPCIT